MWAGLLAGLFLIYFFVSTQVELAHQAQRYLEIYALGLAVSLLLRNLYASELNEICFQLDTP